MKEIKCQNCGAAFLISPESPLQRCAYCGSTYLLSGEENEVLKTAAARIRIAAGSQPKNIDELFRFWLKKGYSRPWHIVQKIQELEKRFIYAPLYVVEAYLESYWDGKYAVQKYRRVDKSRWESSSKGGWRVVHYQEDEPYYEWYRKDGKHSGYYAVSEPASPHLEYYRQSAVNLDSFKPIDLNDFLALTRFIEKPNISAEDAVSKATKSIYNLENIACRSMIDHLLYWEVTKEEKDFFLGYVPVVAFSYKYKNKTFQALYDCNLNRFLGQKPKSIFKILIPVGILLLIIAIAINVVAYYAPQSCRLWKAHIEQVAKTGGGLVVSKDGVKMRTSPNPSSEKNLITILACGTELKILSRQGDWVEVETLNGKKGWCRAELGNMILVQTIPKSVKVISKSGLSVYDTPGKKGAILGKIPCDSECKVLDRMLHWYKLKSPNRLFGWVCGIDEDSGKKYLEEIY
jgi:DNA-directed RNA polymerase subunit RPC12/RpoP